MKVDFEKGVQIPLTHYPPHIYLPKKKDKAVKSIADTSNSSKNNNNNNNNNNK